uniref:Secreted protein n=1 Tax=Caenorhabditis tropicalis TaxID=1561998 RepID=A0A1I7UZ15_9PELO
MKLIIVLFFLSFSGSMAWRINKGNSISKFSSMIFRFKRADPTDEEKKGIIDGYNEGRRQIAKSGPGIANMNKLIQANPELIYKLEDHTILNCWNPKQTVVRCKEVPCIVNGESMQLPYCICGPEPGVHPEDIVIGPPATKCPSGGSVEDGLCVVD